MSLAKENGYRGFANGQFHIFKTKLTNPKSALQRLTIVPSVLRDLGHHVLVSMYDQKVPDILSLLKSEKYEEPIEKFENNLVQGVGDAQDGNRQLDIIKNDISIFKTVRTDGIDDPGAKKGGGLSILAFNTKSRVLLNGSKISIDGILTILGTSREAVCQNVEIPHVWPEFNPYTTALTFPTKHPFLSDETITALNTAIPPKWMTHRSENIGPKYHGFIKTLIEHLFPDEHERERVLDWCYWAIFKRNGTVLCLAGARGTGKSTFIEVLGELVGSDYTELVSESILKERFNAQFTNKRLIVFEEVALSDQAAINKIKAWCNNKISIEKKGQDAISADNHSSMVFLLNDLNDLKVVPQERRFSIPVVAEENLWTVIPEEDIEKFKTGIKERTQESLDAIAEFGEYLKQRGKPKDSEYLAIRGANFNRVADLSLTEWQSTLREFVQNRGEKNVIIPITAIFPINRTGDKADQPKVPTKKFTIANFLQDYRHIGKYKIGDLVDIRESELADLEAYYGIQPGRTGPGSRTRRYYGILPNKNFLEVCGLKYKKAEDLV